MKSGNFIFVIVAAAGLAAGGCGPIKMPRLPKPVHTPQVRVQSVSLIATGEQASRYDVLVVLANPNDVALSLDMADYRVSIAGSSYASQVLPNVVLPKNGTVGFYLPVVVTGPDAARGGPYKATGAITYTPPGEIRKVLFDLGIPKPKASLNASGTIDEASAQR